MKSYIEKRNGLSRNANWVLEYIESVPASQKLTKQDIFDYLDIDADIIEQCFKTLELRKLLEIHGEYVELR